MYEFEQLSKNQLREVCAKATAIRVHGIVEDADRNCYRAERGEQAEYFSAYAVVDGMEEWIADYPTREDAMAEAPFFLSEVRRGA